MGREALYYRVINQETKKWENMPTYGGKLTKNIVQAIARECLAESLKRLEAAGMRLCFIKRNRGLVAGKCSLKSE